MQSVDWTYLISEAVQAMIVRVSTAISSHSTFNLITMHFNLHAACNIADCNKVYYLCTNVSSESSSQGTSSTGHVTHSNEQPITCTLITTRGLAVTCQKEDYQLTFMSTSTACHGDLGINCDLGKQYSHTQC